jgi:hypothetical protein
MGAKFAKNSSAFLASASVILHVGLRNPRSNKYDKGEKQAYRDPKPNNVV